MEGNMPGSRSALSYLLRNPIAAIAVGAGTSLFSVYSLRQKLNSGWPFPLPLMHTPFITLLKPSSKYVNTQYLPTCADSPVHCDPGSSIVPVNFESIEETVVLGAGEDTFHVACQAIMAWRMIDGVEYLTAHSSAGPGSHAPTVGDNLVIVMRIPTGCHTLSPWRVVHADDFVHDIEEKPQSESDNLTSQSDSSQPSQAQCRIRLSSVDGNAVQAQMQFSVEWDRLPAHRRGAEQDDEHIHAPTGAGKELAEGNDSNERGRDDGSWKRSSESRQEGEVRMRIETRFRRAPQASAIGHMLVIAPWHRKAVRDMAAAMASVVRQASDMSATRRHFAREAERVTRIHTADHIAKQIHASHQLRGRGLGQAAREEAHKNLQPKEWRRNNSGKGHPGGFRPETMSRMRKMEHD